MKNEAFALQRWTGEERREVHIPVLKASPSKGLFTFEGPHNNQHCINTVYFSPLQSSYECAFILMPASMAANSNVKQVQSQTMSYHVYVQVVVDYLHN